MFIGYTTRPLARHIGGSSLTTGKEGVQRQGLLMQSTLSHMWLGSSQDVSLKLIFWDPPHPRVVNSILSSVLSGSGFVRLSCSVLWCLLHNTRPLMTGTSFRCLDILQQHPWKGCFCYHLDTGIGSTLEGKKDWHCDSLPLLCCCCHCCVPVFVCIVTHPSGQFCTEPAWQPASCMHVFMSLAKVYQLRHGDRTLCIYEVWGNIFILSPPFAPPRWTVLVWN